MALREVLVGVQCDSQSVSFVQNATVTMDGRDSEPRWYALTVKTQHEEAYAAGLRNQGLEEFLPLYRSRRRWSELIKELDLPLFPRYVFCCFPYEARVAVLRTPGVTSIVRFGRVATPIADREIASLKA